MVYLFIALLKVHTYNFFYNNFFCNGRGFLALFIFVFLSSLILFIFVVIITFIYMVNYYAAPLTFPTSIPSYQTTNQTENINQNIQQHHHRNHHHQQQPSLYYEYFHFIKVCMEWIEVETWNRAKKNKF